jgi:hypothetical protein
VILEMGVLPTLGLKPRSSWFQPPKKLWLLAW